MRILITGSQGFIGQSVGRYATRLGHTVLGIGRSSQPSHDWPGQYVQADVGQTDLSKIISQFSPDTVIHAAGPASVQISLRTPFDDFSGSVVAWANLLDSVRRSEVRPVVVCPSSAAVYGNPVQLPVSEEAPVVPISPYGFHKAACEWLAREYAECFGLNLVICRLFSVFGERQRRLLVWDLYARLVGPEPVVWLEGTGEEVRDYLYVEEVASAMLRLSADRAFQASDGTYRVVNVAGGVPVIVRELAQQLRTFLSSGKEIRCRGTARPGDPVRWWADISRLRTSVPSWEPQPMHERLRACVDAWQADLERASCER